MERLRSLIMMAGLFLIFSIALLVLIYGKRNLTIAFWALALLLSIFMFWHHATDTLKINW